ncbi:SGF29 tudor-like domain [Striga asiatica]|uniref:SGF29 tudor-like domain n=1 Tax=Striga asiatica TaxID=4170 RepID=A0A5A7P9K0_STRAF|nr:SGF29 tudor-like domain [Striga asiatica]
MASNCLPLKYESSPNPIFSCSRGVGPFVISGCGVAQNSCVNCDTKPSSSQSVSSTNGAEFQKEFENDVDGGIFSSQRIWERDCGENYVLEFDDDEEDGSLPQRFVPFHKIGIGGSENEPFTIRVAIHRFADSE